MYYSFSCIKSSLDKWERDSMLVSNINDNIKFRPKKIKDVVLGLERLRNSNKLKYEKNYMIILIIK
jgi:hypothetical protein